MHHGSTLKGPPPAYGGSKVWLFVTDSNGNSSFDGGWIGVVDNSAMAIAQHWTTYTNNKTCNLWSCRDTNIPPCLQWDTTSLLYGKIGFTAISQRNEFEPSLGQCPVTALTPRHGYTRGHGMGWTNAYAGFNANNNGKKVYFCTGDGNNTLVTAVITNGYTRCHGNDGLDYTIFIFAQDLPSTIQPMSIPQNYGVPPSYSVVFNTEQGGHMSANNPPFGIPGSSGFLSADPDAFPPFNEYPTFKDGDSGSPLMLPTTEDVLVFLGGTDTSPASPQMQDDMNTLSQSIGLTSYWEMSPFRLQ